MNWQTILTRAVAGEGSQTAVARALGYSGATVSQMLAGCYAGNVRKFETRLVEVYGEKYGNETVCCPVLGGIPRGRCIRESKKEFSTASPLAVELWDTCPDCEFNQITEIKP